MDSRRPLELLLAFDPLFFEHRSRGYHPERPERLDAARRGVARCEERGVKLVPLASRDATDDELAVAHDPGYLAELARASGHYAALDADTYLAPRSVAAARRAAGGAIALAEALVEAREGGPRCGVALLRPPGHHATREQGMGFCLLNNVALAAYAALAKGLGRVAIVDWDVHHGNGTQDIFWTEDRVLFISLHEHPLYPGTGAAREVGEGKGRGYTINVPLPPAAGDAVYAHAFDEIVLPALDRFAPELVLVSSGFDGHARDPLASMMLTERGYAWMARALRKVADRHAGGRLGLVMEGGYDLAAIEGSMEAALMAALGADAAAGGASGASAGGATPAGASGGGASAGGAVAGEPTEEVEMRYRDAVAAARKVIEEAAVR